MAVVLGVAIYAVGLVGFGSLPLQVVSVNVPTPNAYVVQVEALAGGSWLTITRKEVQATAPVPNTFGAPLPVARQPACA